MRTGRDSDPSGRHAGLLVAARRRQRNRSDRASDGRRGPRPIHRGKSLRRLLPGFRREVWRRDWDVMCLPGRMATQRALVADYANHVARFDEIADYLAAAQPEALMIWGRPRCLLRHRRNAVVDAGPAADGGSHPRRWTFPTGDPRRGCRGADGRIHRAIRRVS